MKAKVLLIVMLVALCAGTQTVSAQTKVRKVRALELEVGGGIVTPTETFGFDKNNLGWNAQGELRYNLKHLPLDVGIHVDGALFNRDGKSFDTAEDLKDIATAKFTSVTGLGVVDLNIGRTKGISLFIGCGVGYGMLISDLSEINKVEDIDRMGCFCVMPRVGIELFHHIRATLYYKNLKTEQSHFGASIGIVFGGGNKKFSTK